jgi:hypothetical protein
MDDKKVVNTQHVKYIETLSRIQNLSLLNRLNSSIDGTVEDTGSVSNKTNSYPMDGAPEPSTPAEPTAPTEPVVARPVERILTRTANKRKPSRCVRNILSPFIETLEDEINKEDAHDTTACNAIETTLDPPKYTAAMKTPDTEHWKTAIESELQSLRDNRTWIVVNKPADVKPLSSRFVFKLRLDADEAIERYKARLVARGDQQIEDVNY